MVVHLAAGTLATGVVAAVGVGAEADLRVGLRLRFGFRVRQGHGAGDKQSDGRDERSVLHLC